MVKSMVKPMVKEIDFNFTEEITAWYRRSRRDLPWRADKEPYHVWVSEIMLQQTRVEAVRDYYRRFMTALPTVSDLASADEETLLKLWQGLGYYNRIRNMHKAARTVCEELGGVFPETFDEIRKLSGIGEYTAGAIASICFDERVAAVDGNVLRVMSRLLDDHTDIQNAAFKKRIGAYLSALYPEKDCGDFTQGLIELGALICGPAGPPKCSLCPAADYCKGRAEGTAASLPVKAAKKERKKVKMTVFIMDCGGKTAVCKRPAKGLLAGLYQFPNVEEGLSAAEAVARAEDFGVKPKDLQKSTEYRHVFTHVEWEMTGYYMTVEAMPDAFRWVTAGEMEREIPLPTAFGYFRE